ncbi:flagellar hook-basal body protein [Tepidibacillus fermentans]|uniref:Flagellar basal-body rod protein FlgG n=1 Tax=Tepidibacillus fermentans TaxID=1281767 RepID=A0A4R3KII3_9BACI|nr:flagellar hook-basal body protein [Tepidibacillus fermentans]TCS83380.1 flagellar basal-body rod protein FlgG [Tepidibacillus fermentans]
MNLSIINSLTGMQSVQQKIDTIANNIANINTNGYKSREIFFQDILSARMEQPEEFRLNGRLTPLGIDEGAGSRVALSVTHFDQGQPIDTGVATDLLLLGENIFFTVLSPNDQITRYTRDGHFFIDGQGYLVTAEGDYVLNHNGTPIQIPNGSSLKVDAMGKLITEDNGGRITDLGYLQLAKVNSLQSLEEAGNNLYQVPAELSNQANNIIENLDMQSPNNRNLFSIQQGKLEGSNVDLAKEMVQLTEAQRQYQFQARALSYSDQMMGMATRLRG